MFWKDTGEKDAGEMLKKEDDGEMVEKEDARDRISKRDEMMSDVDREKRCEEPRDTERDAREIEKPERSERWMVNRKDAGDGNTGEKRERERVSE